ncbi:MAG: GDP-mannose 4,6-dehydratase, partial [Anaerolineae bacterium]|nr:GDP-mannose 4,6-dehydratase [Anaerolineae bacterium]
MPKTALIIGVSSQDGSYLADLLLEKGYRVVGTIRRSTTVDKPNIRHLYGRVHIEAADLLDQESIARLVRHYQPNEVYNIAAQSVPGDSWSHPLYTGEITALGVVRVMEAVRIHAPQARVYQATSREIFGNVQAESATEQTPFDANNPYGIAKAYAHMMTRCYRESYGLFACGGILFNHESPRRSLHFVTRKVTAAVACIKNNV